MYLYEHSPQGLFAFREEGLRIRKHRLQTGRGTAVNDESTRILELDPDSVELQAFFQVDAETKTVSLTNVWRVGLSMLGQQTLAMSVHFDTDPQGERVSMNLGFDLEMARALHRSLGETLDQLENEDGKSTDASGRR